MERFEAMVKGYNKLIDVLKSKYEPKKAGGVPKEETRQGKSKVTKKTVLPLTSSREICGKNICPKQ